MKRACRACNSCVTPRRGLQQNWYRQKFVVSVLHAIGWMGPTETQQFSLPAVQEENTALWSPRLKELHQQLQNTKENDDTLPEKSAQDIKEPESKDSAKRSLESTEGAPEAKRPRVEALSIRGGGELSESSNSHESNDTTPASKVDTATPQDAERLTKDTTTTSQPQVANDRTASNPPKDTAALPIDNTTPVLPPTAYPFAAPFGLHHSAAGDLASYLGALRQSGAGFDLSPVMPSLGSLGLPNPNLMSSVLGAGFNPAAFVNPADLSLNVSAIATDSKPPAKKNKTSTSQDSKAAGSPTPKKRALSDPGLQSNTPDFPKPTGKMTPGLAYMQKPPEPETKLGMKVFVPKIPEKLMTAKTAELIRNGRFFEAARGVKDDEVEKLQAFVRYLVDAGGAVPIPKTTVLTPLRDKLYTLSIFKPSIVFSREIVASAILVWLWVNHEAVFHDAFDKSGRIDVDPECKWHIQAAIDVCVRALGVELVDKGRFVPESPTKKNQAQLSEGEKDSATKRLNFHTACVVSKALDTKIRLNRYVERAIPNFEALTAFLDESRLGALRAKSQERTLLANLLARKSTMSEPFSHAYVSAMVRAGEALGHGKLFETAQNEEVAASTMIPYDIFTDETGAWEDPCQSEECYHPGLTGDDLIRRAHARAMIQKSLRKLQDRCNIKGGATNYGPYSDQPAANRQSESAAPARAGLKRRHSSISEPPPPPGTGSGVATSWNVYDPRHTSEPLIWHPRRLENQPYGMHKKARVRALSLSLGARSGEPRSIKKRSMSMSLPSPEMVSAAELQEGKLPRSTQEIDWGEVAGIFHTVETPRRPPRSAKRRGHGHHESEMPSGPIFAPYCRELGELPDGDESESDEEEADEETVLAQHQVILDQMKTRIAAFLEARKKHQDRRRNRSR